MQNSETLVLFSVNILLHCLEFLECVFISTQIQGRGVIKLYSICLGASLVAKLVKNQPAIRETWVPSLGWEDSLEKGKTNHSSILAWRITWTV